jgi:hypothetical protein
MQVNGNGPYPRVIAAQAARAVWFHRRQVVAASALLVTAGLFVFAAPWLLMLALLERHRTGRRKRLFGLIVLAVVGQAIEWLAREARRQPPKSPTAHACPRCSAPTPLPSRAPHTASRHVRVRGEVYSSPAEAHAEAAALTAQLEQLPLYGPQRARLAEHIDALRRAAEQTGAV